MALIFSGHQVQTLYPGLVIHTFELHEYFEWMSMDVDFSGYCFALLIVKAPCGAVRLQYMPGLSQKNFIISRDGAGNYISSVPGRIEPGLWRVELHFIYVQEDTDYQITFDWGNDTVDSGLSFLPAGFDWQYATKEGTCWYKGDFHTHTTLSDGKMPAEMLMQQAEQAGLDFFVITEHQLIPFAWPHSDIIVIPGVEITCLNGHFNAIGITGDICWGLENRDGGIFTSEGMNRVLNDTGKAKAIRSLNHPLSVPWDWKYKDTLIENFDVIEIWNDPTYPESPASTERTLALWNKLWDDGHTIWGIGGSDVHMTPQERYIEDGMPCLIGDPVTYVHADACSTEKILQNVRAGRVYVSRNLEIDFLIEANGQPILPGTDVSKLFPMMPEENLPQLSTITYTIFLYDSTENYKILFIGNSEEYISLDTKEDCRVIHSFDWDISEYNWSRFEIRKEDGTLIAFSNPVFSGKKVPALLTLGELMNI